MDALKFFENLMEHKFGNPEFLYTALTHSSKSNELGQKYSSCNERLEFLGDSVLSITVSEYLYNRHPDMHEGEMTKLRATIVCTQSLSDVAEKFDFGRFIMLGKGEENTGGRHRMSILADAVEALIAALYLDAGFDKAKTWALRILSENIHRAENGELFKDYKTTLQEELQKTQIATLEYVIVSEEGPDHDKTFVAEVRMDDIILGRGTGKNKKDAQQLAARDALSKYHRID